MADGNKPVIIFPFFAIRHSANEANSSQKGVFNENSSLTPRSTRQYGFSPETIERDLERAAFSGLTTLTFLSL